MKVEELLHRIQQNNAKGEEIVKFIQRELPLLQEAARRKQQEQLVEKAKEENLRLKQDLEFWQQRVIELEVMNGIKQYALPSSTTTVLNLIQKEIVAENSSTTLPNVTSHPSQSSIQKNVTEPQKPNKNEPMTKENKKGKAVVKPDKAQAEEKEVNVSRLDLRIGRILNVKKHPDAESLYVEEIDVGEEKPRTVVSGLVKFVPLEEMQNRLVVVLCNLKPAKMRGVLSEAMVMCASTPEKVEILCPPQSSIPGDRVSCDEYAGEPDPLLPPKKKIFEQVAPDLKTDASCNATYKSALLKVADKGVVKSTSLTNVQIK